MIDLFFQGSAVVLSSGVHLANSHSRMRKAMSGRSFVIQKNLWLTWFNGYQYEGTLVRTPEGKLQMRFPDGDRVLMHEEILNPPKGTVPSDYLSRMAETYFPQGSPIESVWDNGSQRTLSQGTVVGWKDKFTMEVEYREGGKREIISHSMLDIGNGNDVNVNDCGDVRTTSSNARLWDCKGLYKVGPWNQSELEDIDAKIGFPFSRHKEEIEEKVKSLQKEIEDKPKLLKARKPAKPAQQMARKARKKTGRKPHKNSSKSPTVPLKKTEVKAVQAVGISSGHWTKAEHTEFLIQYERYHHRWKDYNICREDKKDNITRRTSQQVRTHHQKWAQKQAAKKLKEQLGEGLGIAAFTLTSAAARVEAGETIVQETAAQGMMMIAEKAAAIERMECVSAATAVEGIMMFARC